MTIPGFQEFMYPFLKMMEDEKEYSLREAYSHLAAEFGLIDKEREEMLPSGKQRVMHNLHNRIGWTRTYLNKAGLLETVRRGNYVITERGKQLLLNPSVEKIDNTFLMRFEEFQAFKNKGVLNPIQLCLL